MQHNFVLNIYSFPIGERGEGYNLLFEAFQGLLAAGIDGDLYALFCDHPDGLGNFTVADNYRYKDFLSDLREKGEVDLQAFLIEMEDKAPALDFLKDEDFNFISDCAFFFPDEAYERSLDTLAIAWCVDGVLLSIASKDKWDIPQIEFAKFSSEADESNTAFLKNVARKKHGLLLRQEYQDIATPELPDAFPMCNFSTEFLEWFATLDEQNAARLRKKLFQAAERRFSGGEPLFKSLHGSEKIREIRFSAHAGGAIRILFARLSEAKWGILVGFIKKADGDGYEEALSKAEALLVDLLAH